MDGRWMDDIDLLKRSKLVITLRLVGLHDERGGEKQANKQTVAKPAELCK